MSSVIFHDQVEDVDQREALLLGLAFTFLFLAAVALLLAPIVKRQSADAFGARWLHLSILPVWTACALALRRALQRARPQRDPLLLPVGLLLAGWGMLTVWRLAPTFGLRQTIWFTIGTGVMLIVLRQPADLRWLRRYRYLWLAAGVALTALTLLMGINPSGIEPRLWLGCCGIYLQPSEPLRLLLISFFASYLADRLAFRWAVRSQTWLTTLAPLIVVWGLSVALLVVQGDLGAGTLYLSILAILLYLASGKRHVLTIAFVFILIGSVLGFGLSDLVRNRFEAWINPWIDPIGGSYQLIQALIAISSGGVVGRGPGLGSPNVIPVVHSDFVFAAVVEEWGLVGGLGLIALFAILVTRGLRVAARSNNSFGMILSSGLSIAFAVQAIFIIGGNIRMLPLAGVTLPFVSYGGSSLMTSMIALSFLLLLSGGRGGSDRFTRPMRIIHGWITAAWVGLALVLGWWTIYRAPALASRTDNPRRATSDLYSLRGSIYDRTGELLAVSIGERGAYQRTYPSPWAATVTGFSSLAYGQAGVERTADKVLRGDQGYPLSTVWWSRLLNGYPPPGLDVRITIDSRLQRFAWERMQDETGAIVIVDSMSGEILAMVSAPSFDPNRLDQDWISLTAREDAPLLNRATQGLYQPGMALAPFVLAWSQANGIAHVDDLVANHSAVFTVDGTELTCLETINYSGDPDYSVTLQAGCPRPFAELGADMGKDGLEGMVQAFGFDRSPSIRLETAPVEDYSAGLTERDWQEDAVGQGDLTVSPLHLARAFSAFLRDGSLPALRVVSEMRDPEGRWQAVSALAVQEQAIEAEVSASIRAALTEESGSLFSYAAQAITGPTGESLAWFVCADLEESAPRLVLVVLENGSLWRAGRIGLSLLDWQAPSSGSP